MNNLSGMKRWNGYLLNDLDLTNREPRWMVVWDDDTIPVRRFIVHYNGYFVDNNDIAYQHANEDVWPKICDYTKRKNFIQENLAMPKKLATEAEEKYLGHEW